MNRKDLRPALTALAVVVSLAGCGDDPSDSGSAGTPTQGSSRTTNGDPSLDGRLMFSRFDEATHSFLSSHVARADGSDETTLEVPWEEGGGQWSHSGDEIAVVTQLADGRIGTAVIDAQGQLQRELTIPDDSLNLVCTVWSPDDSRLACEGWDDTQPERRGLYSVRASDGRDVERLTETPEGLGDLPGDYSPDGSTFLFLRGAEESPGTLFTMSAQGGDPESFATLEVEDPGRYSPDGSSVLTAAAGTLLVLDETGTVVTEIAQPDRYLFGAVWSPDGTHIAYSSTEIREARADVYTSLPDGTDQRQVTSTPENEIRVEWGAVP